jgi:spermidine synthase
LPERGLQLQRRELLLHDAFLICIMGVLAACGLIYEYLLSHYAGRVLGALESTIYTMIGLMIVSMGVGSFAARIFKEPFTAFAWLESLIALLGISCVLLIASLVAFTSILPRIIAETFDIPPDLFPRGGLLASLHRMAILSPYFFGIVIGLFIGMEIPLIARVREAVYGEHLEHNTGTIYGADYLGAGAGAAVWVGLMLSIDITRAAVFTAVANLLAGLFFLIRYWHRIEYRKVLFSMHGIILLLAITVYQFGETWSDELTDLLYRDEVVFSHTSRYQNMTVTRRFTSSEQEPLYGFFLNGRLQFSSNDESIYHAMLVYPAMLAAGTVSNVLIVGGGDGLALRDVLKFDPESVTLIDLDRELVDFFTAREERLPVYRQALVELNEHAFSDERVEVIFGDAFIEVDRLLERNAFFDVILVDLPDPSHPDLDRLYSDHFYKRLNHLLASNGVMAVQSTSPYHAKKAFISIGKTLAISNFNHVQQYRQNIPSFGEWGWSIASKQVQSPRIVLQQQKVRVDHPWLTRDLIIAAFEFPRNFFADADNIEANKLGTNRIYRYHTEAWQKELGVYRN